MCRMPRPRWCRPDREGQEAEGQGRQPDGVRGDRGADDRNRDQRQGAGHGRVRQGSLTGANQGYRSVLPRPRQEEMISVDVLLMIFAGVTAMLAAIVAFRTDITRARGGKILAFAAFFMLPAL